MTGQNIVNYLENKYNIDVLHMNEVGSRAFNLHSDTSDHDGYVIFRQPLEKYAEIDGYMQNIREDSLENDWEIHGWNIKRFGELMYKSNPTTMEYITSPLNHYSKNENIKTIMNEFKEYAVSNVNPIGLYYHYQSLAAKQYNKYILEYTIDEDTLKNSEYNQYLKGGEQTPYLETKDNGVVLKLNEDKHLCTDTSVKNDFIQESTTQRTVKRNLHIVRGICCAKWVKHNKTIPPIDFKLLLEQESFIDNNIKKQINDLIHKKQNDNNNTVGKITPQFIESELNTRINNEEYNKGKLDKDTVNKFIKNMINQ